VREGLERVKDKERKTNGERREKKEVRKGQKSEEGQGQGKDKKETKVTMKDRSRQCRGKNVKSRRKTVNNAEYVVIELYPDRGGDNVAQDRN
jgi:hypothetical protein